MKNRTYISILLFLFSFAALAFIMSLSTTDRIWTVLYKLGFFITNVISVGFLIRNSTIRKTIFFHILLILLVISSFGILFKILHYPGSFALLSSGLGGLLITYSIRFFIKSGKSRQDVLRFLWVSAAAGLNWAIFMHLVPRDLLMIPSVILLITIFDFALFCYQHPAYLDR